mgnify:CR=1 FL=1
MKNLTIIVPLVDFNEAHKEMYDKSLNSVLEADVREEAALIFVGPDSAIKVVKEYNFGGREVLYLSNSKNVDLPFQINKAVKDVKTEYFTVLEFDDNFTPLWLDEVERNMPFLEDVSLYLPLIEVMDFNRREAGAVAYANEPVWASAFSEELGYIDEHSLKSHFNFIVSGGVFRKSDFLAIGGVKNSIKVFFWYEMLLRYVHNGKKVYVIPKVGYEHIVNRMGSLTSEYQQMAQAEIDFWFNVAQEEYVYKTDRKKKYEGTPNE